ncbi:Annexin [Lepidopterella palustris CBS 459.81]|uniref:Annexin n=1 Tax=Lepidopterella palustris CBS 459.81 TaxID=1314670 RepID=A0A8E2E3X3_9PEZI|nr:Annexin [Lepidopterella palustris CBS 459.81]
MSLRVDDRKGRSRSKSPSGKRERSHSHVRAPSPGPTYYASGGSGGGAPQYEVRQPSQPSAEYGPSPTASASNITMGNYSDLPPHERPGYVQQHQQQQQQYGYAQPQDRGPASPTSPSVAYAQPISYSQNPQYGYTQNAANQPGPQRSVSGGPAGSFQYAAPPDKITFTAKPVNQQTQQQPVIRHNTSPQPPNPTAQYQQYYEYAPPTQHGQPQQPPPPTQYQQPPPPTQYQPPPPPTGQQSQHSRQPSGYTYDNHNVVEVVPGGGKIHAPPSPGLRPHSLSVNGPRPDVQGARGPLTAGLPRLDRLSVSGNRPDMHTIIPGQAPPPSPMLEAYHGVYQSISPMPSPLVLPHDDVDDLPPLDSLSPRASSSSVHRSSGHHRTASSSRRASPPSSKSRHGGDKLALERIEREKRVKIYDAEEDALALVDALAQRTPDADALIDILPALSHDQMMELRAEYKRHCKVQGRGINIAKHIKLKTTGNFGKICYVTALGRYESEGYWANYWYQSSSARRELLIEALMGRSNHDMREIKAEFKDKRYSDSLVRCMDKELKADKFRKAVLMALEAERQEESDVWPVEYRNKDVDTLYRALKAREGGESAMLGVVVMRSDAHLREVLRTYERKYGGNFARDALRKSNNLVGEVIAHILNGVINRPARDSMLLHHALMDLIEPPAHAPGPKSSSSKLSSQKSDASSKHERQQRYELVISRLVRLHWDRLHLIRVKKEYEEKYGRVVEEDIEEATKGDFREFCIGLCQTGR